MFLNLGLNALQAMADAHNATSTSPADSETEIPRGRLASAPACATAAAWAGRRNIEVRFSDTGPGLDPRCKEPVHPVFTTKERGTSLEAAISQRIIENHDGFIEVGTRAPPARQQQRYAADHPLSPSGAPGAIAPMTGSSTTGSTPIASSGTTFLVVLPVSTGNQRKVGNGHRLGGLWGLRTVGQLANALLADIWVKHVDRYSSGVAKVSAAAQASISARVKAPFFHCGDSCES